MTGGTPTCTWKGGRKGGAAADAQRPEKRADVASGMADVWLWGGDADGKKDSVTSSWRGAMPILQGLYLVAAWKEKA